jgi:hypothetical protein
LCVLIGAGRMSVSVFYSYFLSVQKQDGHGIGEEKLLYIQPGEKKPPPQFCHAITWPWPSDPLGRRPSSVDTMGEQSTGNSIYARVGRCLDPRRRQGLGSMRAT